MSRTLARFAILCALLAPASAARAEPPPPPRDGPGHGHGPGPVGLDALTAPGGGIPPRVAERLGIGPEKLKQIRDAAFAANDELITLEAGARRAQLQLDRLLAEPTVDEKRALELVEQAGAAELAVRKNRVKLLLRVRALLGPQLWEKVQHAAPPFEAGAEQSLLAVKLGAEIALSIPEIERVAIGDPSVADVRVEAGRIRVKGSAHGRTSLLVWVKGGERHTYLIDVRP